MVSNNIEPFEIVWNNLKAVKDTGDFGGPNAWFFYVMTNRGSWEYISWMDVNKIQQFFTTRLPVYQNQEQSNRYELA